MKLCHGSIKEHLGTLRRANSKGIDSVWSGDIRRNAYLYENLCFGEYYEIIDVNLKVDYKEQYSSFKMTWLKDPNDVTEEDLVEMERSRNEVDCRRR